MKIDSALLEGLQERSRLRLTQEERKDFQAGAALLLDEISRLSHLEPEGLAGAGSPSRCVNVLREDAVEPFAGPDAILAQAPDRGGRYIRVPKTVDQGGKV